MESALCEGGRQPGLRLIETMRWEGGALVRLPLHLARLARGADALGWQVPQMRLRAALESLADLPDAPLRVRLTLDGAGVVRIETGPLAQERPLWRLGLAAARLASGDPWLGIKSSNRAIYDLARAALPEGLDEVILCNERGEICDGTITTLFFDRGRGLRTPPLSCGLLPGVLRAELLAQGAASQEVLAAHDLASVRLWVGNSLRGLIPAVRVG